MDCNSVCKLNSSILVFPFISPEAEGFMRYANIHNIDMSFIYRLNKAYLAIGERIFFF